MLHSDSVTIFYTQKTGVFLTMRYKILEEITFPFALLLFSLICSENLLAHNLLIPKNNVGLEFVAENKLRELHENLKFEHGSIFEEYPEQIMTVMYLEPKAKVLELGSNIGRNSCIIGKLLENSENLVTCECFLNHIPKLQENRDLNNLHFHIESAAVSDVPIHFGLNYLSKPKSIPFDGAFDVNTIRFSELQAKYDIIFDTLIADCEGALYYILKSDPTILSEIQTIITENDYTEIEHFEFLMDLFQHEGFKLIYNLPFHCGIDGRGPLCKDYFYQVWKKIGAE